MQLKVVSLEPQSPAVCRAIFTMIAVISIFKLQSYCDTSYSRGGVNQMWILKNSKDLFRVHILYISINMARQTAGDWGSNETTFNCIILRKSYSLKYWLCKRRTFGWSQVNHYPHLIEATTLIDFVPVQLYSIFNISQHVSNIYKISFPMTCIDILGLFICTSHTK
jgi:hypothetical protein